MNRLNRSVMTAQCSQGCRVLLLGLLHGLLLLALSGMAPAWATPYTSTVWASGLNNPRGLSFAPDGSLWVAESGTPGAGGPSTVLRGETLTYNETGSITRIAGGTQSRVLSGLPSLHVVSTGQVDAGLTDLGFSAAGDLVMLFGAGLNPGVRFTDLAPVGFHFGRLLLPSGPVDVSAHEGAFNPAGGPVDSNPWRMAASAGGTLVTDAGANALLRVNGSGSISTVATFGARNLGGPRPTESVPTGLAVGADGVAYVAELTGFPFVPGSARIHRVLADGTQSVLASGFTMLVDLAIDAAGDLYALEYDDNGLLAPGANGQLWKLGADGSKSLIWRDGLVNPTGLAIGPDGAFYIGNRGNGAGVGEVLRIAAVSTPASWTLVPLAGLLLAWRRGGGRRPKARAASV